MPRLSDLHAPISNIQRYSIHDGPGIRTVVFFLGCPLRCPWCQNPETLVNEPVLMFNRSQCIGCMACVHACPAGATRVGSSGLVEVDRERCGLCGACVTACPAAARQYSAKTYTVGSLLTELLKDRAFYESTGGGVTFSGGEPTQHADFLVEMLRSCVAKRVHTAIETCGQTSWSVLETLRDHTDLFLYDIKLFDSQKHKRWTGVDNRTILHNLRNLTDTHGGVIVRIPLIPGVNDDEAEFRSILDFCGSLKHIEAIHILPFHQFGSSKYESLGKTYTFAEAIEENDASLERCKAMAESRGFFVSVGGGDYPKRTVSSPGKAERRYFLYRLGDGRAGC